MPSSTTRFGRQGEERGRRPRVAREEDEQRLAPAGHAPLLAGQQRFASEVVAHLAHANAQPLVAALLDRARHVRGLHEAVVRHHGEETVAEVLDAGAFLRLHLGHVLGHHVQEDHLLVENLVVLEVVEQDRGDEVQVGGHEDRRALRPASGSRSRATQGSSRSAPCRGASPGEERAAALPRRQHGEDRTPPITSGTQPPWTTLDRLARQERAGRSRAAARRRDRRLEVLQPHPWRATANISTEVMAIVPVTASP